MKQALLVVDVQKDFLVFHGLYPKDRQKILIPKIKKAINAARENKIPVIYLLDSHKNKDDPEIKKIGIIHCLRDTEGEEVISGLKPIEGDIIIRKLTYGGWYKTDLEKTLKKTKNRRLSYLWDYD